MSELHLVTGGAGYFGTLLVERLRETGVRVRIFDINDADERAADVEMIRGDIRDPAAVRRSLEGVSVVHHNVAMVPLAKDKEAFWSVNRDGTRHLLDAAVSRQGPQGRPHVVERRLRRAGAEPGRRRERRPAHRRTTDARSSAPRTFATSTRLAGST